MKRISIPTESAERLRKDKKREWGYQFVSVALKNGQHFEPACTRAREFASDTPGNYYVFCAQTRQILFSVDTSNATPGLD